MIRNPQPTSQEIVGTQMLMHDQHPVPQDPGNSSMGFGAIGVVIFAVVVFLIFDITYLHAVYWNKQNDLANTEDYRITGCVVEELEEEYVLHIDVESLNGQEQTVEISMDDVPLWPYDEEHLLPAYETITITVRMKKTVVSEKEILQLDTYEPQEWEVTFP